MVARCLKLFQWVPGDFRGFHEGFREFQIDFNAFQDVSVGIGGARGWALRVLSLVKRLPFLRFGLSERFQDVSMALRQRFIDVSEVHSRFYGKFTGISGVSGWFSNGLQCVSRYFNRIQGN